MAIAAHQGTMSATMDVPQSQNTAPVLEFRCLYTSDLRRKQKRWQDGRLKFHTFNKRVMVYDEKSNFVGDTHWKGGLDFNEGEELELERGGILVEVGECIGRRDQDLTELVDKRVKEREERMAAKVAHASPSASFLRNPGTPAGSALLRPKPLNAMLTPTGHYGRAVVPTTSPFEDRQAANRDENEPPAKRRKQNDATSSRNGYAQNLIGATLSLSSSKPSSTPTIRYEPFRARKVLQTHPDAIDLTLDDDEERRASDVRRKIAIEQRAAIERPLPRQKRRKKSPPAKGGYASNLTGTPLMLSRSEPKPSLRTMMTKAPVQQQTHEDIDDTSASGLQADLKNHELALVRPSLVAKKSEVAQARHQHVEQSSSKEGNSSSDSEAAPRRSSCPTEKQIQGQPRHQDIEQSSSEEDSSENIKPPTQTSIKRARKGKEMTHQGRNQAGQDSSIEMEDNLVDMKVSPMTGFRKAASKVKRPIAPTRHLEVDSSSAVELESSPQTPPRARKKQKEVTAPACTKVSKATPGFQSRSPSPSRSERVAPALQLDGSFNRSPAVQKSTAAELTPNWSMSALRIKSRPRQKMMMLMNRPSSRPSASNTSFEGSSRPTAPPPSKLRAASDEVVLSQATIRLNTFSEKQKAELEARLKRARPKPPMGEIVSSDPDSGIDHETSDLPLTRKQKPLQKQGENVKRTYQKSSIVDGSTKPQPILSLGNKLMAETSSPVNVDQSSQSREYFPSPKVASAEVQRKEQSHSLSNPSPPMRKPPDPEINIPSPAATSRNNEATLPRSQSKLQTTIAAPENIEENLAEFTGEHFRTVTKNTVHSESIGAESPACSKAQRPPPEKDRFEERATLKKSPEEPETAVQGNLKDPSVQNISTRRGSFTSNDESPFGNITSNGDESQACLERSNPPGQLEDEPPSLPADIEVLEIAGGVMQSSTSRFRAMINPSSRATDLPSRTNSSHIESIETTRSQSLDLSEGQPGPSKEAVKPTPKSPPPVEKALNERPEPCSNIGFTAATKSAALNTPDVASTDSKMGPPRARLANPATRGKSLQSLAANTVDTMNPLFNSIPPPAPRLWSRVERNLERTNSDLDRASEGLLKKAPAGGPWSREAFDLFGIHGPPRVETEIPAT